MASGWRRWFGLASVAFALTVTGSCARSPVGQVTGRRLVVTMQFAGPVNPNYRYYFLIRNANDQSGTNGPIAVITSGGNGFATDLHPGSGTAAFTDFVAFGGQPTNSGYAVYHVNNGIQGSPNDASQFRLFGDPDAFVRPADPNGNVLRFELAISRLTNMIQASGDPVDPTNGNPRFLQVNIVATTKLAFDPQNPDPQKFTDAMGDQHQGSGTFNAVLTIDTATARTYSSTDPAGLAEPDNDTFPAENDPGVEMTGWSIQIVQ